MRIAHLILTHKKDPAMLERLMRALLHPACDFFIHVDKKTPIAPFLSLAKRPNVFLVSDRVPVYWAGYGTVQATLNGFREVITYGDYDYINVLSGQDFPLRSAEQFVNFLRQKRATEFITCESIEDKWRSAASRIHEYHLINWRVPGKFRLEMVINSILPKRKFPLDFNVVGRSNWFTLSIPAVRYILDFLDRNPAVVRYFKYCWGADEFIFATVLYNSPFRDHIEDNLTYVDWTGCTEGHPRVLGKEDFSALRSSTKFFARKFDPDHDKEILNLLERSISVPEPDTQPFTI
jgi:hypothetical protein